ncbi:MAG: twin-arginine translocase subunit TatC [Armatimonadota bacterium]|nr:twin-arginine translocase subunit TatC [Armatimonadota bacterium]
MSRPDDEDSDEKKAELTEHLAELRTRLIRSCLYLGIGMIVMYAFYAPIYHFLAAPILGIMKKLPPGSGFRFNTFTEPFFLKLQIAMVGGLILAVPFVVMELWAFIAPGLTPQEKKGVRFVAPMSVGLFIAGVTCAYLILHMAVRWFLSYLNDFPNAVLLQNPLTYIVFVVQMMLVFGLLFQLPVVLMFLGKIGILTSAIMIQYWRQIAVGLFTLAMVVAPSNDPGTMLALAIPLTLLFFGSISLVKMVEPKEPRV